MQEIQYNLKFKPSMENSFMSHQVVYGVAWFCLGSVPYEVIIMSFWSHFSL